MRRGGADADTSPLGPLHPDGRVLRQVVHGTGEGRALAAGSSVSAESPADLVLLTPARAERRDRSWQDAAVRAASRVDRDGLVVAVDCPRSLRTELLGLNLDPEARLLHVPDVARSRYIVPLGGPAVRYALRSIVPLSPLKRALTPGLSVPGISRLAPTSLVLRPSGARPLFDWICPPVSSADECTAVVARSWRPAGATVVYRFVDAASPDAVAKLGGGAAREAAALETIAAGAGDARVQVPRLLGERRVGELPVVVETALEGTPAMRRLLGSPASAHDLLAAVASWLREWSGVAAQRRSFTPADAERRVLAPARRLAPLLEDGAGYLSRLEGLCERVTGATLPFVAAHNDLTAANILIGDTDRMGIVDWEAAGTECLPLGDLAYAAADFAAAVDGYRDRPAAFDACFEPDGSFAELTGRLLAEAARAHGIGAEQVDLCLQACWLHHADNERREASARDLQERPFLAILRRAAPAA